MPSFEEQFYLENPTRWQALKRDAALLWWLAKYAVLWLIRGTKSSAENLRREAAARGVEPERLIFADKIPHPNHLARLPLADLALDNFYHGGGVTTVDCLWVGMPMLTLSGPTPQSRNGATLLSVIGQDEMIQDEMIQHRIEDYEAKAFALARDPKRLAALRAKLVNARDGYPLFNSKRLTRHLEMAYESMWRNYLDGKAPAMIEVPRLPEDKDEN